MPIYFRSRKILRNTQIAYFWARSMEINDSYSRIIKPTLDVALAVVLIFSLSPLILLIATILLLHNQPVFFVHTRPGRNGCLFPMYKFTSMIGGDVQTRFWFGKLLRKTSLDELPQLINVLRGEMSFIGPRPLLVEYLEEYSEDEKRRHLVRPGITGWAQVNGRNILHRREKIRLDLVYVENISFVFDLKILCKTIIQLLKVNEADYHRLDDYNKRNMIVDVENGASE